GPLVRKPSFGFRVACFYRGAQKQSKMLKRAMDRLARPKTIRRGIEVPLEDRLQDVLHCCLYNPIFDGRDTQGPKFPWLSRLGNEDSPYRTRPVFPRADFSAHLFDEYLDALAKDCLHRQSVYASGATPFVAGDALEGYSQIARVRCET